MKSIGIRYHKQRHLGRLFLLPTATKVLLSFFFVDFFFLKKAIIVLFFLFDMF